MNLVFPDELRTAYRQFDGVDFDDLHPERPRIPPLIILGCQWLPLSRVVDLWRQHRDVAAGLSDEVGLPIAPTPEMKVRDAMWLDPLWIPVGEARSGFFSAVDLHPGPAGTVGQLIQTATGDDAQCVAATSFTDYIERLVVALEEGRLLSLRGDWVNRHGQPVFSLDELHT